MKRISTIFVFLLLLCGTALAQDKQQSAALPQPTQLTVQDLRLKIADLVLQADKMQEYIKVLQDRILELQAEAAKQAPQEKPKPKP